MEWTYIQRTGNLYDPSGKLAWTGYAGNGIGLNSPEHQSWARVGPLPIGVYVIEAPYSHPRLGPDTMNLTPDSTNEMFGRDKFRIHGDAKPFNKSASEGCIVKSPAAARLSIWKSPCHVLRVIAEESGRVPVKPLASVASDINEGNAEAGRDVATL